MSTHKWDAASPHCHKHSILRGTFLFTFNISEVGLCPAVRVASVAPSQQSQWNSYCPCSPRWLELCHCPRSHTEFNYTLKCLQTRIVKCWQLLKLGNGFTGVHYSILSTFFQICSNISIIKRRKNLPKYTKIQPSREMLIVFPEKEKTAVGYQCDISKINI